jgi:hypothetical protein
MNGPQASPLLDFNTVDKKITVNEMTGGQTTLNLFSKLLGLKPHIYVLNSSVNCFTSVKLIDEHGDSSTNEVLKWIVANNSIYPYGGGFKSNIRIYRHLDKNGNVCFVFFHQARHKKLPDSGTFFSLEMLKDKTERKISLTAFFNIKNNDLIDLIKNDGGADESVLKGLIKDTLKGHFSDFSVEKSFSVKSVVSTGS